MESHFSRRHQLLIRGTKAVFSVAAIVGVVVFVLFYIKQSQLLHLLFTWLALLYCTQSAVCIALTLGASNALRPCCHDGLVVS